MRRFWQRIRNGGLAPALTILFVVWLGAPLAVPAFAAPTGEAPDQKQWAQALSFLGRGRFDDASQLVHRLAADPSADARARRVETWLDEFQGLRTDRAGRARQDYDKYVGWVEEETEKGLWRQAIWSCALAFNNVEDQDAFRKEPWLLEAARGAQEAAREYETAGQWFKAATIHARLEEIFPQEKSYREALDRCREHIRLELTYDPESDWETMISGIVPPMAEDAFRRIENDYLKEPVFKDAVIGGLAQTLRMTDEADLAKIFEKLGDEDAVQEFRNRVRFHLTRAEDQDGLTVDDLIKRFERVLEINEETRLFPEPVLVHEFVHGALQPLDRFSDMIWPSDVQEFNKHTQGHFSGVGIQIRKSPGGPIKVVSPLEDTPAYRAGIQPGDLITQINGKSAKKFSITGAVREITGPPGTNVTLTFKRIGEDAEFDVTLTREEITIFTIKGYERDDEGRWKYMIDRERKIGYARMSNFTEGTIDELVEVVSRLKDKEGMRGFIFDLRDNPGGPLKAAVDVSDLFLDAEKLIVSTKDRHEQPWVKTSSNEKHFTDFPMVVVANRYSASASEIVTGALQVHNRALIVGERTYGKGSVQQVLPLNHSRLAFLKLTTALYYLPNGRCLHKEDDSTTWGVDPDVLVDLVPKERIKVNAHRLKKDILKGKNQKQLTEEELEEVAGYEPSTQPADDEDGKAPDEAEKGAEPDEALQDSAPGAEKEFSPGEGEEDEEEMITRSDPNDWPEIDPQLEAALLLMRIRLETNQPWKPDAEALAATPAAPTGS